MALVVRDGGKGEGWWSIKEMEGGREEGGEEVAVASPSSSGDSLGIRLPSAEAEVLPPSCGPVVWRGCMLSCCF
jgi:hypothetical protein